MFESITGYLGPLALLAVRGALVSGLVAAGAGSGAYPILLLAVPVLLALGLATRATAGVVLVMVAAIDATPLSLIAPYPALLAGVLLLRGARSWSADHLIWGAVRRWFARAEDSVRAGLGKLPRVVIVGAGFGGVSAARALADAPCEVVLTDRRNFHLFQPLLYQVATAVLSPADIARPIPELFRDQPNARVLLGEVTGVDIERRQVLMGSERLSFDTLILATGARHSYFGRDDWARWAPGLKQVEDATDLGVEVRTAHQVEAGGVVIAGERVAARTVIWAAGVMASPAARWLEREADRAKRLKVGPNLEVPGLAGVFAIGDTAYAEAWGESPCPDSRQPRSRVVTTWPRWCGHDWKGARRRRPSATDTRVAWPPSAAARRWWTWEGCGCRVPQPGGSGPI